LIRRLVIRGRVQGVGYRAFVARTAAAHGLEGWVRNRTDHTVEAVFSGENEAMDAALAACRRGPHGSRVDTIEVHEGDAGLLQLRHAGDRFSVLVTV
jgi:acylphosphatase